MIISNCVINLSGDKDQVLHEAFRVLKPGGRFAVSDVVVRGEVPAEIRRNVELWVGCVASAMQDSEYMEKLTRAGFAAIEIEPTRIYEIEDARQCLTGRASMSMQLRLWWPACSSAPPSQTAAAPVKRASARVGFFKHSLSQWVLFVLVHSWCMALPR